MFTNVRGVNAPTVAGGPEYGVGKTRVPTIIEHVHYTDTEDTYNLESIDNNK